MTILVDIITRSLSILTLVTHIAIIIFFTYLIIIKLLFKKNIKIIEKTISYFKKNSIIFIFIISLSATIGSLFFSEIAHYTPCELCWYQRIFMYPMSIISLVALIKKQKNIYYYTISLSIIGGLFSLYHYYVSRIKANLITTCSLTGPSCLIDYFKEFDYITFPLMAGTAFLTIFILSIFLYQFNKNKE